MILRKKLVRKAREGRGPPAVPAAGDPPPPALRSRDCADALREAGAEAGALFPRLLRELTRQGWRPPLRSMMGRVSARAEWKNRRK